MTDSSQKKQPQTEEKKISSEFTRHTLPDARQLAEARTGLD